MKRLGEKRLGEMALGEMISDEKTLGEKSLGEKSLGEKTLGELKPLKPNFSEHTGKKIEKTCSFGQSPSLLHSSLSQNPPRQRKPYKII
jgi:hypothetical protein